jgi:hypothetical protein
MDGIFYFLFFDTNERTRMDLQILVVARLCPIFLSCIIDYFGLNSLYSTWLQGNGQFSKVGQFMRGLLILEGKLFPILVRFNSPYDRPFSRNRKEGSNARAENVERQHI